MKKMLINAIHADEVRVAVVENNTLTGLFIETSLKEQIKGNIYRGKITRVEASLNAVFIDYGRDKNGFLPVSDINPAYLPKAAKGKDILKYLHKGMQLPVQVSREEKNKKGALLTTNLSLPGKYLVLVPNQSLAGRSRKIEKEEHRRKIKEIIKELQVPEHMGVIVRTAGMGRTKSDLNRDLNYLMRLWSGIEKDLKSQGEPGLVYREGDIVTRSIRDYLTPDIKEILVDDEETFKRAQDFIQRVMPRRKKIIKYYKDIKPLLNKHDLERQIESTYNREVKLKSGATLVIEQTEAMVTIDVNSGQSTGSRDIEETAFSTNMEATAEIARQLILRDLGGLIVIDFIDMRSRDHIRQVEKAIKDALKADRAHIIICKISQLGLMEISRERLSPPLIEKSHVSCPCCDGTGLIRSIESCVFMALREIQVYISRNRSRIRKVFAGLPEDVAFALLNSKREYLCQLQEKFNIEIIIHAAKDLKRGQINLDSQANI